jgi:hemerythrin-like metal-binding protein
MFWRAVRRWKLLGYQRAVRVMYGGDQTRSFVWQDTLSIQVAAMDDHHKRLIEMANAVIEHLHSNSSHDSLIKAFDTMVDYAHYHFAAEEKLLALYDYPGVRDHRRKHGDLIRQVHEYKARLQVGDVPDRASFLRFFESWLLRHVLDDDRKYGVFLNAKGVY